MWVPLIADADVAEAIHNPVLGEDAIRGNQILDQRVAGWRRRDARLRGSGAKRRPQKSAGERGCRANDELPAYDSTRFWILSGDIHVYEPRLAESQLVRTWIGADVTSCTGTFSRKRCASLVTL